MVERPVYIYVALSRTTEGSMADHYSVPTNAVLDLLRPKWMKGTALPIVAAILLFVLGISAAGCSQADLTEPGDSPVPMMTSSETVQPSLAISISEPTPTPLETAQPLAPRTLWRISGPENLMASTPSANLHIHDVVLSPKHITVVYSIDLLDDDSDGSGASLSLESTLVGSDGGVQRAVNTQRLATYRSTTLASITFEPYTRGNSELYLRSPALALGTPDSSQSSQMSGPIQLQILTTVDPDDSSMSITRLYGLRHSTSGAITAGIPGSFVGSSPRGQVATVGYQVHGVEKWYLVAQDGQVEDLSGEDSTDILGFLGITAPTPAGGHLDGAEQTGDGRAAPVVFPRHNAPLGIDRGEQYLAGKLVVEDGCLRVVVPARSGNLPVSSLVVWPSSFTLEEESGTLRILDGLGRTVAQVGDHIRLSRAAVTYQQAMDREFSAEGVGHCAEPTFWVGDEVSVFDPQNEPTELWLSDPDVLFLRPRDRDGSQPGIPGCGRRRRAGPGRIVPWAENEYNINTIIWPAGFTPHVQDGVVQVRNGAGRLIAQVGDEIAGGGGYGYYEGGHGECSGEMFRVYDIKVLPDVDIYFPNQDGTLATGRVYERVIGELVVNGKCLGLDNAIHVRDGSDLLGPVLLIWPSTFELRIEDGAGEIVDSTERVVARVGDKVQFSAFNITYEQAIEHGGLDEITPACGAPYWAVGDDFRTAEAQ